MLKMMKICSDKCVHCIFDQTSYYALFIIVLLMLNWNCLKVTVLHFTVVIYGLHTKSQHLIGYLLLLTTHTVVFLVSHGDAEPVYANFGINNFETTIRKSTFEFIQRLVKSTNSLNVTIEKSWIVRIDIWNFGQKTLYIATAT